jgi:hypothetical protein
VETAAEGAGWLSRSARSCGSRVGVEAGNVRVVRATLPAARIAAVERGSRGFGRYAFFKCTLLPDCTQTTVVSTSRSVSAFSDVTRRNYRVPV